jgi:hypothetical protein
VLAESGDGASESGTPAEGAMPDTTAADAAQGTTPDATVDAGGGSNTNDATGAVDASADADADAGAIPDAGADHDDAGTCDAGLDGGDPDNCGWCGHACTGSACSGGLCDTQVAFFANTNTMAIDQETIYFTQPPGGGADAGIFAANPTTSIVTPVVAGGQLGPYLLVVRAPYVFWVTADGMIRKVAQDGGAPVTLATGFPSLDCLAANSTDLYWWDYLTGNVYRLPVAGDGGAPVVFYATTGSTGGCVAADDNAVVLTSPAGILQRSLDAGAWTTATVPGTPNHHQLILAGGDVYMQVAVAVDRGSQEALGHVVLGSTAVQTSALGAFAGSETLATANGRVFWAQNPDVYGCLDAPCTGGARHYSNQVPFGAGTVADSNWIYVSSSGSGKVYRFAQ